MKEDRHSSREQILSILTTRDSVNRGVIIYIFNILDYTTARTNVPSNILYINNRPLFIYNGTEKIAVYKKAYYNKHKAVIDSVFMRDNDPMMSEMTTDINLPWRVQIGDSIQIKKNLTIEVLGPASPPSL